MRALLEQIEELDENEVYGRVIGVRGLMVEVAGPLHTMSVGSRVVIETQAQGRLVPIPCEVVGFSGGHALLMPFAPLEGVRRGCRAVVSSVRAAVRPSQAWLARAGGQCDGRADRRQGPAAVGPVALNRVCVLGFSVLLGARGGFPLLVSVPNDEELALAAWRENSIMVVLGAILVCAFVASAAGLLVRGVNRQGELARALRDANDRYHQTLDSVMDAIVAVDDSHNILLFNPAAERMFGLAKSEVLGKPLSRLVPERVREAHSMHMDRFMGIRGRVPRDGREHGNHGPALRRHRVPDRIHDLADGHRRQAAAHGGSAGHHAASA